MATSRRTFLMATALGTTAAARTTTAQASGLLQVDKPIIPAPRDPALWAAFRDQLAVWRERARWQTAYDDALYRKPEFAWAASSFSCAFVMMCDERIYDRQRGRYMFDAFLDHGRREFGGYDSLVLWHAYPRIGVDDRNQFDFYRDLPGGLSGLREAIAAIQVGGIRVYIDYNPWDTGTRREGKPDLDVLVDLVRSLQVDGIFLDTMDRGAAEFRVKLDAVRPGLILEGEGALPVERVHDHHASWAQHFDDSEAPGVLRNKWFERRHMQHQIRRWALDHTGEVHTAWMNGSGMMVWENVFGAWVGWNARDRSLLRAMLPIQRRFAAVFAGDRWYPLVSTEQPGVYASRWETEHLCLWTLINRREKPVEGVLLKTRPIDGRHAYDLIEGRELTPRTEDGRLVFEGRIPPRGIGCVAWAELRFLGDDFPAFLASQAATQTRASLDTSRPRSVTRLSVVASTPKHSTLPAGMVVVSPRPVEELTIEMRVRECGFYDANPKDDRGFWDSYRFQIRTFRRRVTLPRFAIDETPVTNAEYAEFLKATGYRPRHLESFLKHWTDGRLRAGQDDHPVVHVDLDDARAFSRWAGKRLPTEDEWQLAAQGTDGRRYPWGNELLPGRCNDGTTGGTTPVKAFPAGRSSCGCYDLCGNVWQWTESERTDGRTRFCIIRGGSYFSAGGSNWYVDGGPRPVNFATKFLLTWPGLDRSGTIGFRCVADLG